MNKENKMKICILYDATYEALHPEVFLKDYDWEIVFVEPPSYDFLLDLSRKKHFDVYFNLCDGSMEEDRPGLDVVQALEALDLPFTGADSRFYNPTREQMQAVAEIQGIGFARGFHAESLRDLTDAKKLRYPLMVKHPFSYGSKGMTRESRVETPQQLRVQTERMLDEFGGARVEEFIEGSEFTCLVVDNPEDLSSPFAYPPAVVVFPEGETFLHTEPKWLGPTTFARVQDEDLTSRLQEMSKKMFLGLGGMGYGRTDIRMTPEGELVTLEINANPAILYLPEENGPADIPITFDPDGYRGFFERIFGSAIVRHQLRVPIETVNKQRVSVEKARASKSPKAKKTIRH